MGQLLDRAMSDRALRRAWEDVLANDREDGVLSPGVERFADDPKAELEDLGEQLRTGTYRPRDLTEVVIEDDGDPRVLHIPAVRDRVVERSLLDVVTPWVDPRARLHLLRLSAGSRCRRCGAGPGRAACGGSRLGAADRC